MNRPRLLDMFCCAGGAAKGYHDAGFDVVGVDIKAQPRYPFEFIRADIMVDPVENFVAWVRANGFAAIHASPPCQAHTSMKTMPDARPHLDLIPGTRERLIATGLHYVIENVSGSPLLNPVKLCGSMFGLGAKGAQLRRHREFETNWLLMGAGPCQHTSPTIGIYGEGCRDSRRKYDKTIPEFTVVDGREAMGMPWASLAEICEAIPPAYTRHIGQQMIAQLQSQRLAA
ncbi:DNA cytosine methyltransferase [Sphingomonas sp. PP-CC-3A-396]|uniref:DNA cytosine methyltransferase n=1 Tax=Sphingomonas sp. PP-CC-3A-396 TaxID=2135655 RepID=UPI0010519587|nr:DNA cytosine methyltransferase [Sphingomonas sp. PP-CC-3A-396]TCQ04072.1 DNA (cytosine-5)-methyltransferase 1 [Sphingomonas sp. PP-CC-3A-396]